MVTKLFIYIKKTNEAYTNHIPLFTIYNAGW